MAKRLNVKQASDTLESMYVAAIMINENRRKNMRSLPRNARETLREEIALRERKIRALGFAIDFMREKGGAE